MAKPKFNFLLIAFGAHGDGISGGDRIFIELARRWAIKYPVRLWLWEEGLAMVKRQNLSNVDFEVIKISWSRQFGFVGVYLMMIIGGITQSLKLVLSNQLKNNPETVIYSASEFWMDALPALILKWRYRRIRWIAAWYQTAPNPWRGYSEGKRLKRYRLNALLYWLVQLPIRPLIARFADGVLVNNESERKVFKKLNDQHRVKVLIGAVDCRRVEQWLATHRSMKKRYLAVFQGRFHPQKGVLELVEIWSKVVTILPQSKLVMIGDGPLMNEVKLRVKELGLTDNIKLLGYVYDGDKKYQTFSQSRLVVHPSFFDSGGMASAEAMIFGLPVIGFDLKSYRSYYPKGMVKVPIGDIDAFADTIISLAKDNKLASQIGNQAAVLIKQNYSWDRRADEVLSWVKRLQAEA